MAAALTLDAWPRRSWPGAGVELDGEKAGRDWGGVGRQGLRLGVERRRLTGHAVGVCFESQLIQIFENK